MENIWPWLQQWLEKKQVYCWLLLRKKLCPNEWSLRGRYWLLGVLEPLECVEALWNVPKSAHWKIADIVDDCLLLAKDFVS